MANTTAKAYFKELAPSAVRRRRVRRRAAGGRIKETVAQRQDVPRPFAMSAGRERARATFRLLEAPDSLSVQSRREPDGMGLGWFDEQGHPRVRR
jgi:hypothetical protein